MQKEGTLESYLYEVECAGIDSVLSGLIKKYDSFVLIQFYDELGRTRNFRELTGGKVLSTADPDCVIGVKITDDAIYMKEVLLRE